MTTTSIPSVPATPRDPNLKELQEKLRSGFFPLWLLSTIQSWNQDGSQDPYAIQLQEAAERDLGIKAGPFYAWLRTLKTARFIDEGVPRKSKSTGRGVIPYVLTEAGEQAKAVLIHEARTLLRNMEGPPQ